MVEDAAPICTLTTAELTGRLPSLRAGGRSQDRAQRARSISSRIRPMPLGL